MVSGGSVVADKDDDREERESSPGFERNVISEQTGQYDLRFILWRQFCRENNVPVESLPGDLEGDIRDQWQEFKNARLPGKMKKR